MIDQSGEVLTNRNVPNGAEPILKVIGGLPPMAPRVGLLRCIHRKLGFRPRTKPVAKHLARPAKHRSAP